MLKKKTFGKVTATVVKNKFKEAGGFSGGVAALSTGKGKNFKGVRAMYEKGNPKGKFYAGVGADYNGKSGGVSVQVNTKKKKGVKVSLHRK